MGRLVKLGNLVGPHAAFRPLCRCPNNHLVSVVLWGYYGGHGHSSLELTKPVTVRYWARWWSLQPRWNCPTRCWGRTSGVSCAARSHVNALDRAGVLHINDSKKVHQAKRGYGALERGVLGFLMARGDHDGTLDTAGQLLTAVGADHTADAIGPYPWYGTQLSAMPLTYDRTDVTLAANALRTDLAGHDAAVRALWSCVLPAGQYNALVAAMDNKASVLFHLASRLIDRAWRTFSGSNLQIVVDRQGGRSHYRRPLAAMFPDLHLKILKESDTVSSYELSDGKRTMRIHFIVKGDAAQLPVAVASMTSKYLRELFMDCLNAWFAGHITGLAPTAGYYTDGKPFSGRLGRGRLEPRPPPHGPPGPQSLSCTNGRICVCGWF